MVVAAAVVVVDPAADWLAPLADSRPPPIEPDCVEPGFEDPEIRVGCALIHVL